MLNSIETTEHTLRMAPGVYEVDVVNPGGGTLTSTKITVKACQALEKKLEPSTQ